MWQALMNEFDEAGHDVLMKLRVHEAEGTEEALGALLRAQLRRSEALRDMLQFLDALDDTGSARR
jgi:hypothetical protein